MSYLEIVTHTDMMTREEADTVKLVYSRLYESEYDSLIGKGEECHWTDLDDNLEFFSYLSDSELVREVQINHLVYSKGRVFRCAQNHKQEYCFAPYVLESSESIVKLYEETKELHCKNRYILIYFLAMSEMKLIYAV